LFEEPIQQFTAPSPTPYARTHTHTEYDKIKINQYERDPD